MCAIAKPIFKNVFPNQYVVKVKIAIITFATDLCSLVRVTIIHFIGPY